MNTNQCDPVIDEVREARRRISEQFGHDPAKLVAHYMHMQEIFRDRLIGTEKSTNANLDAVEPTPSADADTVQ